MKLYQYAILKHPTEKEKKDGKESEVIVDLTTTLAHDDQGALLKAARAIPEGEMANLNRLEVAVRPF